MYVKNQVLNKKIPNQIVFYDSFKEDTNNTLEFKGSVFKMSRQFFKQFLQKKQF